MWKSVPSSFFGSTHFYLLHAPSFVRTDLSWGDLHTPCTSANGCTKPISGSLQPGPLQPTHSEDRGLTRPSLCWGRKSLGKEAEVRSVLRWSGQGCPENYSGKKNN